MCGTLNGNKPAMELYNCSNVCVVIESCCFQHYVTQPMALSEIQGNVITSRCMFAFNDHFKGNGVAKKLL